MSPQRSDLFLMGLLSVIDAILDLPMTTVLSYLPLSPDVHTALSGGANRFRDVYDTLLSYERADWTALSSLAAKIGCAEARVPESYLSAANRAAVVST
jgi:EAL and modified HD-GYP domain-containing signal transduction protein